MQEVFAVQTRAMNGSVEGFLEQMNKAVSRTGEDVNTQLTINDKAMQQELNRAIEDMGKALAQITGRFTSDYTELVKEMQTVVHLQGHAA